MTLVCDRFMGRPSFALQRVHLQWVSGEEYWFVTDEIEEWCNFTLKGTWSVAATHVPVIYFQHDSDYIMFKMRWL
jgi:hypothetical protein